MSRAESIPEWVDALQNYTAPKIDSMPEIYLYMDQVLNYMEKLLQLFSTETDSRVLTPSMVNNYVKNGVLERPKQKKYSREHLVSLFIICILKNVLSIPDIACLLKNFSKTSTEDLYQDFCSMFEQATGEIGDRLLACPENNEERYRLALRFSAEASARRFAAEHILQSLQEADKQPKPPKR